MSKNINATYHKVFLALLQDQLFIQYPEFNIHW